MRRSDPFRRQPVRKSDHSLFSHPFTSLLLMWLYDYLHDDTWPRPLRGFASHQAEEDYWKMAFVTAGKGYACYAACFRYHPAASICRLAWASPAPDARYMVTLGHGDESCPEQYFVTSGELGGGGRQRLDFVEHYWLFTQTTFCQPVVPTCTERFACGTFH
jgi:hypothetical protein